MSFTVYSMALLALLIGSLLAVSCTCGTRNEKQAVRIGVLIVTPLWSIGCAVWFYWLLWGTGS